MSALINESEQLLDIPDRPAAAYIVDPAQSLIQSYTPLPNDMAQIVMSHLGYSECRQIRNMLHDEWQHRRDAERQEEMEEENWDDDYPGEESDFGAEAGWTSADDDYDGYDYSYETIREENRYINRD